MYTYIQMSSDGSTISTRILRGMPVPRDVRSADEDCSSVHEVNEFNQKERLGELGCVSS
jgi:hypothetical protein